MSAQKTKSGLLKKAGLVCLILVVYLVTSVPVGLFLYSLKSNMDIDVFSRTGFHSYLSCLKDQAAKI
ncbi:MAG: hypothetical protein JWO78_2230 [Micavibrio sp.]|nr:hypothetical protein [Micavibrio sp.]